MQCCKKNGGYYESESKKTEKRQASFKNHYKWSKRSQMFQQRINIYTMNSTMTRYM